MYLILARSVFSLSSMLVIRKVLGNKQTLAYISLVIMLSAAAGLIFGSL